MTQETHCACLFEWRPTPDFSGKPPVQTDECGYHSQQRLSLEHRLQEAERHLNRLTGMKFSDRMHAALVSRTESAEARVEAMAEALRQFAECYLTDANCASMEVANARIRALARAALLLGGKT